MPTLQNSTSHRNQSAPRRYQQSNVAKIIQNGLRLAERQGGDAAKVATLRPWTVMHRGAAAARDADHPCRRRYPNGAQDMPAAAPEGKGGLPGHDVELFEFWKAIHDQEDVYERPGVNRSERRRRRGRGGESRRRPWRRVAATPRLRRGSSAEATSAKASRGDAAVTTWIVRGGDVRGGESRRRRACDEDRPRRPRLRGGLSRGDAWPRRSHSVGGDAGVRSRPAPAGTRSRSSGRSASSSRSSARRPSPRA